MLEENEIDAALRDLPEWRRDGDALVRVITVPGGFSDAIAFVACLAAAADQADHHPDVAISWNRVTVRWSTHSAGGITARDVEMARRTDEIAASG
jgi:4a-hydroxytetrahydrobiopterin dehydratase